MSSRYQEWLAHVFDHEVENPEWYFTDGAPEFVAEPGEIVELLGETFLHAGRDLTKYPDAQVDQGLWYMVSVSGSDFIRTLQSPEIQLAKRLETVGNIFHLYSDCFAKRCLETLGHLSEEGSPLNSSCYMFWDISSLACLKNAPGIEQIEDACLDVLQKILATEHRACRESALHGLSEFTFSRPEKAHEIIDEFLSKTKLDDKLLAYALKAREGNVQ